MQQLEQYADETQPGSRADLREKPRRPLTSTLISMKLFYFIKHLHDQLLAWSTDITFDKRNQHDFARIALYSTLIEFTGAIICLIDNRARVAVPSTFRSLLEAAVELRNLNKNPSYVEHMYASHTDEWLKVLKEAKKGNPYLASLKELNLDEIIANDERTLSELRKKGKQPLKIFKRFERAGMVEEYHSMYNFLSCDAHSNIRAHVTRHFEESGGDFNLVLYKDEPVESFVATLDSVAGLLVHASIATHKAFASKRVSEVESLLSQLETIRREYAT